METVGGVENEATEILTPLQQVSGSLLETGDKEEEDLADDRNQAAPDRAERWTRTHAGLVPIVQRPPIPAHSRVCGGSFRS